MFIEKPLLLRSRGNININIITSKIIKKYYITKIHAVVLNGKKKNNDVMFCHVANIMIHGPEVPHPEQNLEISYQTISAKRTVYL